VLVIRRFAPHPCGAAYGVLSADASSQPLGHPSGKRGRLTQLPHAFNAVYYWMMRVG